MPSPSISSLPVGTLFAFRIDARASLEHLEDELESDVPAVDEGAAPLEGKVFVGYVRDVSLQFSSCAECIG